MTVVQPDGGGSGVVNGGTASRAVGNDSWTGAGAGESTRKQQWREATTVAVGGDSRRGHCAGGVVDVRCPNADVR